MSAVASKQRETRENQKRKRKEKTLKDSRLVVKKGELEKAMKMKKTYQELLREVIGGIKRGETRANEMTSLFRGRAKKRETDTTEHLIG